MLCVCAKIVNNSDISTIYADMYFQNTTHIFRSARSTHSTFRRVSFNALVFSNITTADSLHYQSRSVENQSIL